MTPTVRTFRAPDSAAALAAVKAALGPEAVILATRTVDGGLFRRAEVEITAALEPAGPGPALAGPPRRPAAAAPRP
ncbi:flagellar biosynthesis protein FlhF, partial [Anaeromyxobacter sp. Red801]